MKHHHFRTLTFAACFFTLALVTAAPVSADGYYVFTRLNSKFITSIEQLQKIGDNASYPLSDNYTLENDIDASATRTWNSGAGFKPIGDEVTPFTGSFDGGGHVISNLYINRPTDDYIGLFAAVSDNGTIFRIGLDNATVHGVNYVGALVGLNADDNSSIISCYSTGVVTGAHFYIGGLIGGNHGFIANSYSTSAVTGIDYVGGLVGENISYTSYGYIYESYSAGAVTGRNYVGGLVGLNSGGYIWACYSTSAVTGVNYVGGLVGRNFIYSHRGDIEECYSAGLVTGAHYVGGLVGSTSATSYMDGSYEWFYIWNCFWDNETSGQASSAGGAPKTTAEMMNIDTFKTWDEDEDGEGESWYYWDFINVWGIFNGKTYPFFRGANDAPVAVEDTYRVDLLYPLEVSAPGVLANDNDSDGSWDISRFKAILVRQTQYGTVNLSDDGSFTYEPDYDYAFYVHSFIDSFTYKVSDQTGSDNDNSSVTKVWIIVGQYVPPVVTPDSYRIDMNEVLITGDNESLHPGVLYNDDDGFGITTNTVLTAVLASNPVHGELSEFNDDGTFIYTPDDGFVGVDIFTYRAFNGWDYSVETTVTITVGHNFPPVVTPDSYSVKKDGLLVVIDEKDFIFDNVSIYDGFDFYTNGVLDNDYDVDNLTAVIKSYPVHGELFIDRPAKVSRGYDPYEWFGLSPNGSFIYRPNEGFVGTDTFTYKAFDGMAYSVETTVTITVGSNAAPVVTPDFYSVAENTELVIDAPGVLANDSDPDDDLIDRFQKPLVPLGGYLTAVLASKPVNGELSEFNDDGSFTYSPDEGFAGTDAFTYRAFDGIAYSVETTVTITVGCNVARVVENDFYYTPRGAQLTVVEPEGVLANDDDPDPACITTNTIFAAVLVSNPVHGEINEFNDDGTFTYTPDSGFVGIDTFTYKALVGITESAVATVTITVGSNAPPVVVSDEYYTPRDTLLTKNAHDGVLHNDNDSDPGDAANLTALLVSTTVHGLLDLNDNGSFTYMPDHGYIGIDTFTYVAFDNITVSAVATVTITVGSNAAPVVTPDNYLVAENPAVLTITVVNGVLANDNDSDGDSLTAVLASRPMHGALVFNANGSFTYTPAADFRGLDSFTYRAFDGMDYSVEATVTIIVGDNNPPVVQPDFYSVDEGETLIIAAPGVLVNDYDIDDADRINATLTAVLASTPVHGNIYLFSTDGSFRYEPVDGFVGIDTFTYRAFDGIAYSVETTVTITVGSNAAPIVANDNYTTPRETTLRVAAPGVLANDIDPDDDTMTAVLVSNPMYGALVDFNDNGSFTYQPKPGFVGIDSFTYRAFDGIAESAVATVTITVGSNAAPVVAPDFYSVAENIELVIAAPGVLANDTDPDEHLYRSMLRSSVLTAVLATNPVHGSLSFNADGSFTYMPGTDYRGFDSFTYRAYDGIDFSVETTVTITVGNPDPPVAVSDSYSVEEDGELLVIEEGDPYFDPFFELADIPVGEIDYNDGVLHNDFELDFIFDHSHDNLTAVLESTTGHGIMVLSPAGSFIYQPEKGFVGTDTFTYRAFNGLAYSAAATVTITVGINAPPVVVSDDYYTPRETRLTVPAKGVLANDNDSDPGDEEDLTAVLVSTTEHGVLDLNDNGSFTYTPENGFIGIDIFTYMAFDGIAYSAAATVTITVGSNAPPVVEPDSYSVAKNGILTIAASGVLANDTDPDGDAMTAVEGSKPVHGVLVFNANGSFTYTPAHNYRGLDTFTYRAFDGMDYSVEAKVTITVGSNTEPVVTSDNYSTPRETKLVVSAAAGVLHNDTDADNDTLMAVLVSTTENGVLDLNDNGSFTYTPDHGYVGIDTFTYGVFDGMGYSPVATVTITVGSNAPPVVEPDSYSVAENGVLTIAARGVLANDTDPDGDTITAVEGSKPVHGVLVFNANGSFHYVPDTEFIGIDTFTYRAFDGMDYSVEATVMITVGSMYQPLADPDYYSVEKNGLLLVKADNDTFFEEQDIEGEIDYYEGVLYNDFDLGIENDYGENLTAVLESTALHGMLYLSPLGSIFYRPDHGYVGIDTFTYRAFNGLAYSAAATVTITVGNNAEPVATSDNYSTPRETTLRVNAHYGVLHNDNDSDNDTLVAGLVSTTENGVLDLNDNGSFTYTPDHGYVGIDTFTYRAFDGIAYSAVATVTITVGSNAPPVVEPDSYSVAENGVLTITARGVLANDTDPDGDAITAVEGSKPVHGVLVLNANGSFIYTPAHNYRGLDSFTYRAFDGMDYSVEATVTITVGSNTAPIVTADSYATERDTLLTIVAPGVLGNDEDPDNDSMTAVIVSVTAHGFIFLNANGSFTYTPDDGFVGIDSFTYMAFDGMEYSPVATVTIAVGSNAAPIVEPDSYSVEKDGELVTEAGNGPVRVMRSALPPGVLDNDFDPDGDDFIAVRGCDPVHGYFVEFNTNGSFVYRPHQGYVGIDTFTYWAYDGMEYSAEATVTITVGSNDPPVVAYDNYTTPRDTVLAVAAPGVLHNDYDPDNNTLTAVLAGTAAHGTLVLSDNGSFIYTPDEGFVGIDIFTYVANDGMVDSAVAPVRITVGQNKAPQVAPDQYGVEKNNRLTVSGSGVLLNDADADHDTLTAVLASTTVHGTLVLRADGSFTYTPAANYMGSDSFTYKANDGYTDSAVATVTISVVDSTLPMGVADEYRSPRKIPLVVRAPGLLANDSDASGRALTAVLATAPVHGSISLSADGSFIYFPDPDCGCIDTFTYKAGNGSTESDPVDVTITVNSAPTAVADAYTLQTYKRFSVVAPGVLANDSAPDGDTLTALLVTPPQSGDFALNSDGSFLYMPDTGFRGDDSFTYRVYDGFEYSDPATVVLSVKSRCTLVAVYGEGSSEVLALRKYRDEVLEKTAAGKAMIKLYDSVSPVAEKLVAKNRLIKLMVKGVFDRIVPLVENRKN